MPQRPTSRLKRAKLSIVTGLLLWSLPAAAGTNSCHQALARVATHAGTLRDQTAHFDQTFQSLAPNRGSLIKIREAVAAQGLGDLNRVGLVFYPFSGADAGTPALLFPSSHTIIGYDSVPFVAPRTSWDLGDQTVKGAERGFATYREIDEITEYDQAVVAHLIHSLRNFVPNLRIRAVDGFTTPENEDEDEDEEDLATRSHGVIEFDAGEGTPVRRYIHLSEYMPNIFDVRGGYQAPRLVERVLEGQTPDAVLVKASMSRLTARSADPHLRGAIKRWLAASGGYLIEGEEQVDEPQTQGLPEFSHAERLDRTDTIVVPAAPFGYTHRAHVTRFR